MMKKILLFPVILMLLSEYGFCQPEIPPQIQELMEDLISETDDDSELAIIYEHLEAVLQNPYNINSVSREQLESLFIISDFQIYTFMEYREKYGRILSLKELDLIIGFNPDIIDKLNAFLFAGDESFHSQQTHSKRYSDFKILNRYVKSTPARNGFLEETDSLRKFSGNNYSRLLKLQYKFGKNFSSGLTMESDAGEAFSFDKHTKGFDFYSAYFQVYRPEKLINNIIVGDFRLSSGLGLIHGYGFSSKTSEALIKQKFTEIKRFSSSAESGFYRGLAIESSVSKFESILYFSRNYQTANLKIDENDNVFFSSIDISGLHRNISEQNHKNSILEQNSGFILSRLNKTSRFSYIANLTQFEQPFQYRKYPDRYSQLRNTNKFFNQSVSYKKLFSKFIMLGEIALDGNHNLAIQQILNAYLHPLLSMSMSYRYFSPRYIALHSNSFSESSKTRNEKGFYLGIETFPFRFLILNAYIDSYSFPWMRYNDTAPYSGTDLLINAKWLWNKNFDIKTLFKKELFHEKTLSKINNIAEMNAANNIRFVLQTNYAISDQLNLKNKIEIKYFQTHDQKQTGYLLYQEISKKFPDKMLSINFRYTMFDIPDWSVRIYSWEHDLLYSFCTPVFYRTGQNILFNLRYTYKNIKFGVKGSFNIYKNEYSSGSGVEKRSGTIFSTFKIQWIYTI